MARADLLVNLVRAASRGDQALFRSTVEALVAEERAMQHHVLAQRIEDGFKANGSNQGRGPISGDATAGNLLHEIQAKRSLKELILPAHVEAACGELVEEQSRKEILRSYGLEPRHRVLLAGPPGNGKTTVAEGIAEALMLPLLVVRYEAVIGSYLGETASRLRKLFDYVRARQCVLFLDEFDTIGKERGDIHETGEIKRVVSSLLLQMDALPSHVVVVAASNHPELFDRAVWRRFQLRLLLPQPGRAEIEVWLQRFEERMALSLGHSRRALAERLRGASFAEVEEFGMDILRRNALAGAEMNVRAIVESRLKQWKSRVSAS